MEDRTRKDEAAVLRIAARLGLDVERLKADMQSAEVNEHIETSMALARELGFTGTPSFVVGREGIFGYVSRDELSAYVARAREAATE
jgi:predicted DsbA family dithiol-disulfide isomerase